MKAAGRTLSSWELYREICDHLARRDVVVQGAPDSDPIEVREVRAESGRLVLEVDHDAVYDQTTTAVLDLVRAYLAKEIIARDFRKRAAELLEEE